MRTVALPEATGLAVLWLGGRLVLGVWPASVLWLSGRLVLGVWPFSLPEASCVGWTSGPGRLARLFEASCVVLVAAPLKATSRQLHLDHDLASFWKEKTLLSASWKRPSERSVDQVLQGEGMPRQGGGTNLFLTSCNS